MPIFVPGDTVVQGEIEVALHLCSVDVAADVWFCGDPLQTETARDPAFLEANMKRRYYRMVLHHVIGPNIHPKLTMCCPCDGRNVLLISTTLSAGFLCYSGVQFGNYAFVPQPMA